MRYSVGCLHNLQGPVQNDNVGAPCLKMSYFKMATAEH